MREPKGYQYHAGLLLNSSLRLRNTSCRHQQEGRCKCQCLLEDMIRPCVSHCQNMSTDQTSPAWMAIKWRDGPRHEPRFQASARRRDISSRWRRLHTRGTARIYRKPDMCCRGHVLVVGSQVWDGETQAWVVKSQAWVVESHARDVESHIWVVNSSTWKIENQTWAVVQDLRCRETGLNGREPGSRCTEPGMMCREPDSRYKHTRLSCIQAGLHCCRQANLSCKEPSVSCKNTRFSRKQTRHVF